MKKALFAVAIAMVSGAFFVPIAYAGVDTFQNVPNPNSECVTGVLSGPAIGSIVSETPTCKTVDSNIGTNAWDLGNTWTSTSSYEVGIYNTSGATTTFTVGNKYLFVIGSVTLANLPYASPFCPRYIYNQSNVAVGTHKAWQDGSVDASDDNYPYYTASGYAGTNNAVIVTCIYTMNASTTIASSLRFSVDTSTSSQPATFMAPLYNPYIYTVFSTSTGSTLSHASGGPLENISNFNEFISNFPNSGSSSSSSGSNLASCGTLDIFCYISNAFQYVFMPTEESLDQFSNLGDLLRTKAPFSYVASTTAVWSGLVASTTANSPTWTMNYHDVGIGSTTPLGNILPNFTAFSATTTKSLFPAGTFDLLKALAGITILLGLIADIFFTVRNLMQQKE